MIRAAWLLGRGRSPENSGFQRHPAASISNISVPVPVDSTSQLCNITQVRMGWNSNVWMPWNWIHMETRALQSAMDNSHLTAQHPPRVQVPYTLWPQLLNLSPTQALHLAKSLAVFHFPLPERAVNTACPVFHRELHENWLHWGKILLWVIRQNKNQTNSRKTCYGEAFPQMTEQSNKRSFREQRETSFDWHSLPERMKSWKDFENEREMWVFPLHRDFVWLYYNQSGLTPPLNSHFSLPPKVERWQEHLQFLPFLRGISNSNTRDK